MFTLRTAARVWRCPNRNSTRVASSGYREYHRQQSQNRFLKVSEEVQDALNTGKPVVALETTIYTHGKLRLRVVRCFKELKNSNRLSLPGEHRPRFAARIYRAGQWRGSGNDWDSQWYRACWYVCRGAYRAGKFCRDQIRTEGFSQRSQLYLWTGNIPSYLPISSLVEFAEYPKRESVEGKSMAEPQSRGR